MIKGIFEKPTAKIILIAESLNSFPLGLETRQKYLLITFIQYYVAGYT